MPQAAAGMNLHPWRKFRANNSWDINIGGDLNNLNYGGDNISATEGKYTITLNLSNPEAFVATVVSAP